MRQALRNFRTDRVRDSAIFDDFFPGQGERLRKEWVAGWKSDDANAD